MHIKQEDSLEFLKGHKEFSADIIYSDPPYALGSEIVIKENGKPDYSKATDFMDKWDMPTGEWWEDWFAEAYRTLKYGGYCIMFGMDRQLLLFKYYAHAAGFTEKQSMYWYFISNFPKASDLSKNIDKNAGAERELIGFDEEKAARFRSGLKGQHEGYDRPWMHKPDAEIKKAGITAPSTPLAKKYNGYKYSIAPLKQTNETILVFQKPYKTGSCLHDTLAMENGDEECCCGAVDVERNRVGTGTGETRKVNYPNIKGDNYNQGKESYNNTGTVEYEVTDSGRYPSQTFCNTEAAEHIGEPSKILHKCDYEKNEHDLYHYVPKVSKQERNAGCEDVKSNHPTLKPIALNERILRLFKTPNDQKILYPFAGSGSEVIGGLKAGFKNWEACELSAEYIKIAEARIKYWSSVPKQGGLLDKQ